MDGTADQRISLCGGRGAILDGEDWEASGYGLHLQGDHWTVSGITVTNAQKGIVADGVTGVVLTGLDVHGTGHEAIHFRTHSTGNVFDGSGLVGADSWVDVKGRGYLIAGNIGTNSPQDGFQTHVIDDMEWGTENDFVANTATVDGPGVGFYIHDAEDTTNVVACDNIVTGAAGGVSNLPGGCNG